MDTFFTLPLPFFLSVTALFGLGLVAWNHRYSGWGLPMGVVLGTTALWYHGDALYNDYEEYRERVGDAALEAGWWQVLLFLVAFGFLVPRVHALVNANYLGRRSNLMLYMETRRLEHPYFQHQIDKLCGALLICWLGLMAVALVRVDFNFIGLFAPYLGEKQSPWGRGRLGGGISALLSLGGYVQILLTAGFGVLAALARNPTTRATAIFVCFLAFPFYLFDRTRNTMLATMLPGVLAWIFMRLRVGLVVKGAVLLIFFMLVNFWFAFVIANRTDSTIASAIRSDDSFEKVDSTKHAGISMFSELGYMNLYFAEGTFEPSWGGRYFAELVNPIPRGLWKNKPLVGIDYAIARGFGNEDEGGTSAGVTASIATGMIGQGVVNFGRWLGPLAPALLLALWVSVLARLDFRGTDPARMLLYSVGMILTINMGRDITFLVLYPYVFGWVLLTFRDWMSDSRVPHPGGGKRTENRRKA